MTDLAPSTSASIQPAGEAVRVLLVPGRSVAKWRCGGQRQGRACPGQLLNPEAADRPRDDELLDLLFSLEDVHGLSNPSRRCTRVRDLRFPPQSVESTRLRRVLVLGLVLPRSDVGQPALSAGEPER
jgi:hypothetical protein